ncbi:hypothetical protein [Rouxiella badensis]|uniref:hypothetical protein n=1 Tax=Rouxiella badensis TaxID=1646377 RepID=UPI003C78FBBC
MRLTFSHFNDRPSWAAAAGYNFNIIDCLSFAARRYGLSEILDLLEDTGDIEIRSVLWKLPINFVAICILVFWPLIYWVNGLALYVVCIKNRRKYRNYKSERVQINLRNWLEDFEQRSRRGRK